MTTTSAAPADLDAYVDVAGDGTARLTTTAADLRGALDAFRASEGRATFIADVPEVDLDLSFLAQRWDRLAGWLAGVAEAFRTADGQGRARTLADEELAGLAGRFVGPEVEVIERDGRLILDTGSGDDVVRLEQRGTGVVATVNGTTYTFVGTGSEVVVRLGAGSDEATALGDGWRGLVLDGGTGQDALEAEGGTTVLRGGAGDDRLRGGHDADRLLGGAGADRIRGGAGADRILGAAGGDTIDGQSGDDWVSAGEDDDLVYGEGGDDLIDGGGGRDHVDGGSGVDHVDGGRGDDIASGGEGHDTVDGGSGGDVLLGGPGRDLVAAGPGVDSVHVEGDDVVAGAQGPVERVEDRVVPVHLVDAIVIEPPHGAFADRVRSDLVTLASTASGAALLESLRGHTITVVEDLPYSAATTDAYDPREDTVQYALDDDHPGFAAYTATSPSREPSYSPLVGLHHELVHASHDVNGTPVPGRYTGPDREQLDTNRDGVVTREEGRDRWGVPLGDRPIANEERATVGLPIDHDEDPSTPDVPADDVHDGVAITENDLRDELGLPHRERY